MHTASLPDLSIRVNEHSPHRFPHSLRDSVEGVLFIGPGRYDMIFRHLRGRVHWDMERQAVEPMAFTFRTLQPHRSRPYRVSINLSTKKA